LQVVADVVVCVLTRDLAGLLQDAQRVAMVLHVAEQKRQPDANMQKEDVKHLPQLQFLQLVNYTTVSRFITNCLLAELLDGCWKALTRLLDGCLDTSIETEWHSVWHLMVMFVVTLTGAWKGLMQQLTICGPPVAGE